MALISELLGVDLPPYEPQHALNVSPPPEFLTLQRRINRMLEAQAPEVLATPEWRQFKFIANFSAGSAKETLKGYFDYFFDANPVDASDMPVQPEAVSETSAQSMTALRQLPHYQPFLPVYGLSQA